MGTWRYVVSCSKKEDYDELEWEIRELYPTKNGKFGYTADSVKPYGNSFEELVQDLEHMRQDCKREILDLRSDEPRLVPLDALLEELSK